MSVIDETATTTIRAHVLLQLDPGCSPAARSYLLAVPGVLDVAETAGAFDAVVEVEVGDSVALQRVVRDARRCPGLFRLRLCRTGSPEAEPQQPDVEPGQAFHNWTPWSAALSANA